MYSAISSNKRKSAFLVSAVIALLIALGYAIDRAFQGGGSILTLAIGLSFFMTLISYFAGDKIALSVSRAQPIKKEENPYVYRLVENLCIGSGLPTPKIYVISDPAINAFATGRDPQHASIAVTTGAIEKLANEELEGVLAHELSHVKNYDIRFMMLIAVLVGAVVMVSDILFRSHLFGRHSSRDRGVHIFAIIAIVLAILSPFIAQLIKLAASRKREFLADASGAYLTRFPEGLANALQKIAAENQPMAAANHATAHLFFSNPFGATSRAGALKRFANLWSTHPPVEDRIRQLRTMDRSA